MNKIEEIFREENSIKEISIGNVKISMRNYLYLTMMREWIYKGGMMDYSTLIDCMIKDFIDAHMDEIKRLKEEKHQEGKDWLVDTLFGK